MSIRILQGDCRQVMATLPESSVDAIVTDPPYELGFMGKGWDRTGVANDVETWRQCLRVLKPGGHLLAFSGTRTQHRMVCAIEDAGFEIRDQAGWMYGSGFPKSLDVSKAIDKAAGAVREVIQRGERSAARPVVEDQSGGKAYRLAGDASVTSPATEAAKQWQGWGTALKPAWEPICVARKPLAKGMSVAANVLAYGTGAINIDGSRIAWASAGDEAEAKAKNAHADFGSGPRENKVFGKDDRDRGEAGNYDAPGRWPANLLHDGSPEVVALFPGEAGGQDKRQGLTPGSRPGGFGGVGSDKGSSTPNARLYADDGSAARFFWSPKASASDRHEGLENPGHQFKMGRLPHHAEKVNATGKGNHHPTVKPTDLMRYLCRLVTPPGGVVLDPFMGSGSTLKAAELEGFSAIGIELSPEYIAIAQRRIAADAPLFASVEVA